MLFGALLLSSCSKYGFVRLKYPTDPNVMLPGNIQRIAVVSRSLTPKEYKGGTITEAVLTGEVAGSDKIASDESLKAIYDRMNGFRGYAIVFPKKTRLMGTGSRVTPDVLDWKTVRTICDSTHSDVLLVLEMFDSNSDLLTTTINNQINDVLSGKVKPPTPPSQIRMNVLSFWRMYDPRNETIIDQFQSTNYLTFNTSPPLFAPPPEALPRTAYSAGEEYVERFLPGYYNVKRDMYKRGKGSFKPQFLAAFRKSEVANWEGAYASWLEIAQRSNGKNAGRACLNLAVACEVLGKYEEALSWAKKSYEDYGNKIGREYANKLKYRVDIE
jgi:hypothetical protein